MNNKNRINGFVVIFLLVGLKFAYAETLEPTNYRIEHVAGVWQSGYLDGPAKGAMFQGTNITKDKDGNIYVADGTRIRVISKGRVWTLAGNGIRGFRDGRADEAMFNTGGRGYSYCNIRIDSRGNIYIPDGYNNRIRKIFKKNHVIWWVETYAGGGEFILKPGQSSKAKEIAVSNPVSLAVDIFDNVWTEGFSGIYKITPSGKTFCYKNVAGNVVNMQADKIGNVYLLVRENWASHYWKVTQDGAMERIAGLTEKEINQLKKEKMPLHVDGSALTSTFWSHSTFAVAPDGKEIYGGNGDEHVVRRVKDGTSMTLFNDGWRVEHNDRRNGWFLGGPILMDSDGSIYLFGNNPPIFLRFRRIVPEE
jgi:hypothetical protein